MSQIIPSNDEPYFVYTGDLRELVHCKYCWEPLYCVYDHKLRDVCYPCELEQRILASE